VSYTTTDQIIWKNVSNRKWTKFAFVCVDLQEIIWGVGLGGGSRIVLMCLRGESIRLLWIQWQTFRFYKIREFLE